MVKINLTSSRSIQVEEPIASVIKRLHDNGKHLVEFEQVKPRRMTVWVNPQHVVDVSSDFSG